MVSTALSAEETTTEETTTEKESAEGATETTKSEETTTDETATTDEKATETSAKGYWPEDWKNTISKGDEKRANVLGRYASPEAVADALIAAQAKIRSGELKSSLPEKANDKQLADWRKDNGIPEKPEDYDLKFESGLVIGADDKPFIDEFLKSAHSKNLSPDQVKSSIEWYYDTQNKQAEAQLEKDEAESQETQDKMYSEWGNDTRRNVNLINSVLSRFPEEVADSLKSARLADGTAIFNNYDVMRTFLGMALEMNPAGISTPAGGGDVMQTLNDEIASIKSLMSAPEGSKEHSKYWKDQKVQDRYRTLIEQRDKMGKT